MQLAILAVFFGALRGPGSIETELHVIQRGMHVFQPAQGDAQCHFNLLGCQASTLDQGGSGDSQDAFGFEQPTMRMVE